MSARYKIAVTGAGGFLGSALVQALTVHPRVEWVRCLHPRPPTAGRTPPKVQLQVGELADPGTSRRLVSGADTVVHFATRGFPSDPVEHPNELVTQNVAVMGHLLEAMTQSGVPRLIHASSGGAIYAPSSADTPLREDAPVEIRSPYALSKLIQEQFIGLYQNTKGLQGCCLRISNPYGPGQWGRSRQGIFGAAFQKALAGEPLPLWGTLETRKDFLYIGDTVEAFLSVLLAPKFPVGTFHVGSGVGTSLKEGLALVEKVSGFRLQLQPMAPKSSDTQWVVLNSDKLKQATGWHATTSLEEGLKRTWNEIQTLHPRKVA